MKLNKKTPRVEITNKCIRYTEKDTFPIKTNIFFEKNAFKLTLKIIEYTVITPDEKFPKEYEYKPKIDVNAEYDKLSLCIPARYSPKISSGIENLD